MADNDIVIAKIKGPHGVKGLFKVDVFCENLELLKISKPLPISLKNKHKNNTWIASSPSVLTREDADKIKSTDLTVRKDQLPEIDTDEEFYFADLIGMTVIDEQGASVGKVIAYENFGAGDLLEIQPLSGQSFYLSYTADTVKAIDSDKNVITVNIPELI